MAHFSYSESMSGSSQHGVQVVPFKTSAGSLRVLLLHGNLDIWVREAKNLPNMDLFHKKLDNLLGGLAKLGSKKEGSPKITSDPYVTVSVSNAVVARTYVINNSENPIWMQHFYVPVAHYASEVHFVVKDNDVVGSQIIGAVGISVEQLCSGAMIEGTFPVLNSSGKPCKEGAVLTLSIQFTPMERVPLYHGGVGGDHEYQGVPGTYFPLRRGGKVTLYQDAHVPEGSLPNLWLENRVQYQHGQCWQDIFDAITQARRLIYITGWSVYHLVTLVRDNDNAEKSMLGEILKRKSQEGVRVLLLIWDDPTSKSILGYKTEGIMGTNDEETRRYFKHSSVQVLLCPRSAGKGHSWAKKQETETIYTHHQKTVILDADAGNYQRKIMAFVGGLDLCKGRYDTPAHPIFRTLQNVHKDDFHQPNYTGPTTGCPREPWHDLHSRIEGPAAYDVLTNFEERWLKASKRHGLQKMKASHDDALLKLDRIPDILGIADVPCLREDDADTWHVQIFRSIDSNSVKGFPKDPKEATNMNLVCGKNVLIDMSIHTAYVKAIRAAQHFIYIENQYFLGSSYNWSNYQNLGANNLIPMEIALKIANKIRANERFAAYIVLPMWPEGNPTSTPTQRILFWQYNTMQMMYETIYKALQEVGLENTYEPQDYLMFFCLGNREVPENGIIALHLIAVILGSEGNAGLLKYLLSGFQLLHSLGDLASRHPKIEQILLDDVKVSEQLLDLVFYSLVVLCTYRKVSNDMVLLHSTLVASSLYLLTVCISSQWLELAQVLLAYNKVDVLMDSAFAAVTADIKILQRNLSADHAHSRQAYGLKAEETLNHLCQQCEASLQFLQSLCQQKLFRERLVKNKELSSKGRVLLLAQVVLRLDVSPLVTVSSSIVAAVSRLKSKVLTILLNLCEADSLSYLDEVASTPASLDLAKSIALEVLNLLKKMFGMDVQQSVAPSDKIYPKGQLQLNAMRLADIFSDDSNFRSFITTHFTEILTGIFSVTHGEFLSTWCSSDLPIREEDATLEYDPFAAAGWVLDLFPFSDQLNAMSTESTFVPSNVPRLSYPHQRTSLLVKVLANLHCFVPDICKEEKDLFLNKFVQCLRTEVSNTSEGFITFSDPQKAATVRRNLGSLLSHAESLIPTFLNEEDVQLLRVFITQLESLVTPFTENRVQEAQNLGGYLPPQLREVSLGLNNRSANSREDILDNSSLQRLNQLNSRTNDAGQSGEAGTKGEMIEHERFIATCIEMKDIETQNVETSGSDSSSTRSRHPTDQVGKVEQINCNGPGEVREDETVEAQHEEKQQRKRKRTIMNDKQISLVEKALMGEPDMQRNKNLLEKWAVKLSDHGSEVTKSQLKNWLNNRKARLARAAKDGRVLSEGDSLDKQGGLLTLLPCGSPGSPVEDVGILSAARENAPRLTGLAPSSTCLTENTTAVPAASSEPAVCVAGDYVVLINEKAEEIGRGKVCQVSGKWYQRDLEELGTCVVDIIDLKVERSAKLPYPSELTGTSFDQAERKFGFMRVLWQSSKLLVLPAR